MTGQPSLFSRSGDVPLAERLRPKTLADYIGQKHILGPGMPLTVAIAQQKPFSMLLWGAPGCGKTTLALLLADAFDARYIRLSAVFSGVKEVREAVLEAQQERRLGRKTILFIDEIHRFNKAQQDAFLPYVESGLLTFIGATTENPSFEVNPALLSRAQVYVLQALSADELARLTAKVLALPEYLSFSLEADAQKLLIQTADGDARRLLNLLEQLLRAAATRRISRLNADFLADSLGSQIRRFDKGGESFYNQISALHKSVRGSHPNAALYWLCRMLDGGADPRALSIANEAAHTYERLGSPEGELALAQAVLYLAAAAKSNAGYTAYNQMRQFVKQHGSAEVPPHLRNAPTKLMKELGYGRAYRCAHDEPHAYAAGESYMPDDLPEPDFYQPVPRGLEIKIAEKLAWLKSLDEQAEAE